MYGGLPFESKKTELTQLGRVLRMLIPSARMERKQRFDSAVEGLKHVRFRRKTIDRRMGTLYCLSSARNHIRPSDFS